MSEAEFDKWFQFLTLVLAMICHILYQRGHQRQTNKSFAVLNRFGSSVTQRKISKILTTSRVGAELGQNLHLGESLTKDLDLLELVRTESKKINKETIDQVPEKEQD